MTDPTTDRITLTDQEREVIGWWDDGRYGCHHTEHVCPTPDECRGKYGLVAAVEQIVNDAVVSRLAALFGDAQADAWAEGYDDGSRDASWFLGWATSELRTDPRPESTPNPYRELLCGAEFSDGRGLLPYLCTKTNGHTGKHQWRGHVEYGEDA